MFRSQILIWVSAHFFWLIPVGFGHFEFIAADVELKITVPDAWVDVTIAAINSKWPKPTGITQKKWAETQIRIWLRNIVGAYKRTLDRSAALDAGGYIETRDDDIPIEISS